MKKLLAVMLAALLSFTLFVACSNANAGQNPDGGNETATHDDSIVIAIESEPTTLNPYDHAAVVSGYMNQLTYNRLFKFSIDTLQPEADLVSAFENIDELTWSFTLKEGIKFHDGSDMTSEDVKASLEFARTFTSSNKYTGFWSEIEIVNDLTFIIRTHKPYAMILNDLAANGNTILPSELIEAGNDFNQNPIGSGPYKFVKWTLGESLDFIKNDEYFDTENAPSITNMTWRIIPEGSSRTIALEMGEVDLVIDVESTDVERLKLSDTIEVAEVQGTRMNFFSLNNETELFSNVLVRKAINCLVDKAAVIEVSANGQGQVAVGMNPAAYLGTTDEGADNLNISLALSYLDQAGVDPTEIEFTCMAYTDATRRTAEVIQSCLAEVGITMHIESLDFAAFLSRLLEGSFEAGIAGYSSSDVLTFMKGLWHSGSINAANSSRINSAELDALIDLADTQLDEAERNETIKAICIMTNEETPYVPLFTSSVIRAFNPELKGVEVSASGLMYYANLSWE